MLLLIWFNPAFCRLEAVHALREAVIAILRHPVSSLATLTTATVSFTLLLLAALSLWNLDRIVGAAERELTVAVFLKPEADLHALAQRVQRWPEVYRVEAIPKDEALKRLSEEQPWVAEVAELLENPLPDTLLVTPQSADQMSPLAQKLAALPGVDQVEYGGRITMELLRVAQGVRIGAVALVLMLILNTFFSVMGTIRLSIESRRDELEIMQLVGATRGMILFPFIMEGLLLTIGAALIAAAIALPVYRYLAGELQRFYPFLPVLTPNDLLLASEGLFLLAFVLGSVGGWLSSRAHLKETV